MGEASPLLFCAGLPFVGDRHLTSGDLARVREWTRSVAFRSLAWVVGIPLAAIIIIAAGSLTGREEWAAAAVFAGSVLVWVNVAPLISRARDFVRLWRLPDREVAVLAFEGNLKDVRAIDPTGAILFFDRLLERSIEARQTIEVFGRSGLVWTVNGRNPQRTIRASMARLSTLPESARVAARWAAPLPGYPNLAVRDRALSLEERAELRELAKRLLPAKQIVLCVSSAAFLGAMAARYGVRTLVAEVPFWVLMIWWSYSLARQTIFSIRLFQHSKAGRATIVTSLHGESELAISAVKGYWEYLSGSPYLWTRDGVPAFWRGAGWTSWKEIEKRRFHPSGSRASE